MTLTESLSARVGASAVRAIISTSATFRQFLCYSLTTISHAIGGTIGLVKNGVHDLTLTGGANYTGPTIINQGQLIISSIVTLNGVISGSGRIYKSGSHAITIGGNNTYSGGTISAGGTITYLSSNAFGTGSFTAQTASQIITGQAVNLPNNFIVNAGATLQYRTTGAPTITVSGTISGSGSINKSGNGYLDLTVATLTYTGGTTIQGGFIRAKKTVGASTATATFQSGNLSLVVSFNVPPPSGTTNFRFFLGTTTQTYTSGVITLVGLPAGSSATYTSATSTLAVTVL